MGSSEKSLGLLVQRRVVFDREIGRDWAGSRISFLFYANTVPKPALSILQTYSARPVAVKPNGVAGPREDQQEEGFSWLRKAIQYMPRRHVRIRQRYILSYSRMRFLPLRLAAYKA